MMSKKNFLITVNPAGPGSPGSPRSPISPLGPFISGIVIKRLDTTDSEQEHDCWRQIIVTQRVLINLVESY